MRGRRDESFSRRVLGRGALSLMAYFYGWLQPNRSGKWVAPGVSTTATDEQTPALSAFANFTPASGPVGTVVTILGTNLLDTTDVQFNGVTATVVDVVSSAVIHATVPVGGTTGRVTVITPEGPTRSADTFTVTADVDPGDPDPDPPPPDPDGFTDMFEDQFDTGELDAAKWYAYDGSTFGSPTRIQVYETANVIVGTGSAGSTGGTSLKLRSIEVDAGSGTLPTSGSKGTRYSYTAGMVDSKTAGFFLPRYGRFRFRCKTPHGQGLWPSIWLTAMTGGATMAELDILEYFHTQVPGKNSITLHGTAGTTSTSGAFAANRYTNNVGGREFFEAPTATPGWHVWEAIVKPVTDAGGLTYADPTLPSRYVEYVFTLDTVQKYRFVDTAAMYYTTHGGSEDYFWNIYLQGCQIDGNYVGHPRSPLGYSHWRNACLISGTAPSSCATTTGGYSVRATTFGDPGSTLEIDYFKAWKYTG